MDTFEKGAYSEKTGVIRYLSRNKNNESIYFVSLLKLNLSKSDTQASMENFLLETQLFQLAIALTLTYIRFEQGYQSVSCSIQGDSVEEENDQDDVREGCCEVHRLKQN